MPRTQGAVDRGRLFARIDAAISPVVWVTGPPGAGKTTLAASYVAARGRTTIWYHVDAADADPATFFHYMDSAAAHVGLARGEPLPRLSAESAGNPGGFAQRYFRVLFARLPASAVLVLDNFQEATGPQFETFVRDALEQVPEGHRVIVVSLADPPGALARLVANRRIEVIAPEALLLTLDESHEVLARYEELEPQVRTELTAHAGGWAAGLVLMAEHARRVGADSAMLAASSCEAVFDYFAGEILARETPARRRTLLLVAALTRLTGPLAKTASGDDDAERMLEELHRRHLFIHRTHGVEASYQLHALFRDFLRVRAAQELPAAVRAAAALRAAQMLERTGACEDAIPLYVAAGDIAAATRLVLAEAERLYAQGRARTLLDYIGALPAPTVASEPWLAYWAGACEVWVTPMVAQARLQQALAGFVLAGDREGQVLAAGALTRACLLSPDWAPLDQSIADLAALLDDAHAMLAPATRLTGYSRLVYAAIARQPGHPRLPEWAASALAALGAAHDPNDSVMAGFSLLQYQLAVGNTAEQERVVRAVDPLLADPAVTLVTRCYWQWVVATFALRTGSARDSLAQMDAAVELADSHGLAIAAVLRRFRVVHALTVPDLARAATELATLENARRVEPYYEVRAWLALQRGDLPTALQEARTALQLARERGRTHYHALDLYGLAVIHAEAGALVEAREAIALYRREVEGVPGPLPAYHALLVDAYVAWRAGAHEPCKEALARALAIGERERYRSHWFWHPTMMARLYAVALVHGIAVRYVEEVIRSHALPPPTPDVGTWPWPVAVHTLGTFTVAVGGRPLRFEGKAQRKPLELLKALVALGGRDVSARALIDILWPGPLEDGGQKALEITVHRLRRLLASDDVVRVIDRRVTLDADLVWVDARTLDSLFASLATAPGSPDIGITVLEAAVPRMLDLYRGEFLPGEPDTAWLMPARNRLAGRFQRVVLTVGGHGEHTGQWAQALALYQRATELDALAETFYRRQMSCLRRMGRRAEAINVYRRCRQMLSVVLCVAPSPETEAVLRELRDD